MECLAQWTFHIHFDYPECKSPSYVKKCLKNVLGVCFLSPPAATAWAQDVGSADWWTSPGTLGQKLAMCRNRASGGFILVGSDSGRNADQTCPLDESSCSFRVGPLVSFVRGTVFSLLSRPMAVMFCWIISVDLRLVRWPYNPVVVWSVWKNQNVYVAVLNAS